MVTELTQIGGKTQPSVTLQPMMIKIRPPSIGAALELRSSLF
jgi:hypothetical protein